MDNKKRLSRIEAKVRKLLSQNPKTDSKFLLEIVRLEMLYTKLQHLVVVKGWRVMDECFDVEGEIGFLTRSEDILASGLTAENLENMDTSVELSGIADLTDMELHDIFASIGLLGMVCEVAYDKMSKEGGDNNGQ